MSYQLTQEEQDFVHSSTTPEVARHCVLYAATMNSLELSIVENSFAADVVYDSQVVYGQLEGRTQVVDYLRGKLRTLNSAGGSALVRVELGILSSDQPCILIYQRESNYGEPGIGSIVAHVQLQLNFEQKISYVLVCIIPGPETIRRSGCFPGIVPERLRSEINFRGLRIHPHSACFVLVHLPGVHEHTKMKQVVESVGHEFGIASIQVIEDLDDSQADTDFATKHGIHEFPTLCVLKDNVLVRRVIGFQSADNLRSRLCDLFYKNT